MGILNPVYIYATGPVALRYPYARAGLPQYPAVPPFATAACTLSVQLRNATSSPVTGDLKCIVDTGANQITVDTVVTVAPLDSPVIIIGPQNRPHFQ